jgi:hypothetical protein
VIRSQWALGLVVAIAFVGASSADAAILLQDNFDGYADQAAFEAAWPVVTAPSGTLSTAQSVTAPNSIHYAANTANVQRNQRLFTESGNPSASNIVRFSLDFYDSNAALAPYRQHANLQDGTAPGSGGQLISMGLNNNLTSAQEGGNYYMARILGANSNGGTAGAYFKLNDAGAPLRSTGWHNLAVEISDVDFKFYVDGILAETTPQGALLLRSYDVVRLGSGLSSTAEAFYDNVTVETIPEPSALALLVLGGAGLLMLRRRAVIRSHS